MLWQRRKKLWHKVQLAACELIVVQQQHGPLLVLRLE